MASVYNVSRKGRFLKRFESVSETIEFLRSLPGREKITVRELEKEGKTTIFYPFADLLLEDTPSRLIRILEQYL